MNKNKNSKKAARLLKLYPKSTKITKKELKDELTNLEKHSSVENLRIPNRTAFNGFIIETKNLRLKAFNEVSVPLGKFHIEFHSHIIIDAPSINKVLHRWSFLAFNTTDKKCHPHGNGDLCLDTREVLKALKKGKLYVAVDTYINLLERFNLNDPTGLNAGAWFVGKKWNSREEAINDLTSLQLKKEIN